jgi:cytochrome c556
MKRIVLLAATLACAATVGAQAQQVKAEDQVKQRQSAFAVLGHNFANLGAMAQEKKPYSKDEAVRSAEIVAVLAPYPHGFFGEGTDKGTTKARPEIWQKRSDFDAKMEKMIGETRKLPQAARTDLAALKAAVGDAGKACKACHDDYRAK